MARIYYGSVPNTRKPEKDRVLSRKQASEYLKVSMSTLDRYIAARIIPFVKVGGRVLFSQLRLNEWFLSKENIPDKREIKNCGGRINV